MITGVGPAMSMSLMQWSNPIRPIRSSGIYIRNLERWCIHIFKDTLIYIEFHSAGLFGQYMVTPANNALFIINGKARTVNCEIGGVLHPTSVIWTLPNVGNRNSNIINKNNIISNGNAIVEPPIPQN